MKKIILIAFLLSLSCMFAVAQSGNVVLIETYTETGCGACAQYDSAFSALMKSNEDKVAVINYHCYYTGDPFTNYVNKAGDKRYAWYPVTGGFPTTMINGLKPIPSSSHISYVTAPLINSEYNKPPQFKVEITTSSKTKRGVHKADILVKATALKDFQGKDLRVFVVVTENNINYQERYHSKSTNGLNNFNYIMRALLPDTAGTAIGSQMTGDMKKVKISFTNDEKEINYKEVRIVAFVQDANTKEVLGTAVTKETPFR